ncbi:TIGR00341 family protein [Romeria aff. gracilis LEGE 07310]|uniref:TIGR00341 family protein n=1 Tax=Vasconcelosia minhoensis LEGE 07310 TaxID=915328 RepID=A0A8J7A9K7_9CYAN|nr:TIGR00341 family protein [Romeria gracilis]MBE9079802.1 TIGR00341 family protein [Romeria aff. gracilis LEGE 07310]
MSLRLVEIRIPESKAKDIKTLIEEKAVMEVWQQRLPGQQLFRLLLYANQAESVIDELLAQFADDSQFQLILLPVEACIPRPPLPETAKQSLADDEDTAAKPRIFREEIYGRVTDDLQFSENQMLMIVLSTAIAAIGILRGNQAVIIGAMVLAPLLKPNMALAVATSLGDVRLAWRTLKEGLTGIFVTLTFSCLVGLLVPVSPNLPEIASRIYVSPADLLLAFASGIAGAVSLTIGERRAIVGVMVSVALLPPVVVLGLLVGAGHWSAAVGTLLLVSVNIICLNLAAVLTLLVQDVRPRQWWAGVRAKQMTNLALAFWLVLLAAIVSIIFAFRSKIGVA